MKQSIFKVFCLVVMALSMAACSKDKGNNTSNQYILLSNGACYDNVTKQQVAQTLCHGNTTQYQWINGQCYDNNLRNYVSPNLCSSVNSGQYTYLNGQCYDNFNRTYVQTSFCSNYGGSYGTQICSGIYIWNGQRVQCTGQVGTIQGCSGYTLISEATGQTVTCQ